MKGIYLAAYKAHHPKYDIIYQDINGKRDISGDMLDIDLTQYDFIITTPPCNYYSRARGNRPPSQYAKDTMHLLPEIIIELTGLHKPFIVENVRNKNLFRRLGLFRLDCYVYEIGRHTYWTNHPFNPTNIKQINDFKTGGIRLHNFVEGGYNVHNIIEYWLEIIHSSPKTAP